MTFLPRTRFLIDTSAFARVNHPIVHNIIAGFIDAEVACTCLTVDLEAGYSARGREDIQRVHDNRQDRYVDLPISGWAAQRARRVQILLAERGLHRAAGPLDLITAAVAEEHRAIVLHYDTDFEHIASVTGQAQQWIVPRGSLI